MNHYLPKPLHRMSNKEVKRLRQQMVVAFAKEYGPGVLERLERKGLVKWIGRGRKR